MLLISLQTLRARRGTLAGAFIAIWLAVTLAYGTGLLMDGSLSAPGPGRFAAAEAVVRAKPADPTMPAQRLDAALVKRFEGGVGDISFPVGAWSGGRRLGSAPLHAHGWASAALTPYRLTSRRNLRTASASSWGRSSCGAWPASSNSKRAPRISRARRWPTAADSSRSCRPQSTSVGLWMRLVCAATERVSTVARRVARALPRAAGVLNAW